MPAPGMHLGVDFGTSHTVAVLRWSDGRARPLLFDGSPLLPSAVYAEPAGGLVVGRDAVHSARLDPGRFEPNPKRRIDDNVLLLGDREVPVVEVVTAVLSRVNDELRRTAGQSPVEATFTCPASWGATRRLVLADAAAAAGLGPVRLVPEPVAAAAYFAQVLGRDVPIGSVVVVYDFGAGTMDASVVARTSGGFEVLAVDGRDDIGGVDIDASVIELIGAVCRERDAQAWERLANPSTVEERRARRLLWDDARTAKERLSRHPTADLTVGLLEYDVHVTRQELEDLARPLLVQTVRVTQEVMRRAKLVEGRVAGVFLVGGSSRIPLVATLLHRALGEAPVAIEQPELVVAEGSLLAVSPASGSAVGAASAAMGAASAVGAPAAGANAAAAIAGAATGAGASVAGALAGAATGAGAPAGAAAGTAAATGANTATGALASAAAPAAGALASAATAPPTMADATMTDATVADAFHPPVDVPGRDQRDRMPGDGAASTPAAGPAPVPAAPSRSAVSATPVSPAAQPRSVGRVIVPGARRPPDRPGPPRDASPAALPPTRQLPRYDDQVPPDHPAGTRAQPDHQAGTPASPVYRAGVAAPPTTGPRPADQPGGPLPADRPAGPSRSARPTGLAPTGLASTGPASTGPAPTGPASTGPASTGPAPTGSASTGPASTGPASTGRAPTGRAPTDVASAGGGAPAAYRAPRRSGAAGRALRVLLVIALLIVVPVLSAYIAYKATVGEAFWPLRL